MHRLIEKLRNNRLLVRDLGLELRNKVFCWIVLPESDLEIDRAKKLKVGCVVVDDEAEEADGEAGG